MIIYLICSIIWGVLAIMNLISIIAGSTPIVMGIILVILNITLCVLDAIMYKQEKDKRKFKF